MKFLRFLFLIAFVQMINFDPLPAQNILFVGGGTSAESVQSDTMLVDSLQSWGYNIYYIDDDGFDASTNAIYEGMDAVFFNESVGASKTRNFGPYRDNFPLPCVILDAGALENHSDRWNMFTAEGDILTNPSPDSTDFYMQINDTSHYITRNYNQDTIVKWSNTTDYGVVPFIHGIQYDMVPLSIPITPLGNPDAFTMGALDSNPFPNRMFYFGITKDFIHDGSQIEATSDFFHLIRRGTEWILADTIPPTCEASFDFRHLSETVIPGAVSFQFSDSSVASSNIVDWKWKFGDDDSSDVQHPVKNYQFYKNSPDSFLVTLSVETDEECTDDTSQYVKVGHLRPECDAMFTYQMDSSSYHSYYQFTNISESDSITHFTWNMSNDTLKDKEDPYQYLPLIPGDSVSICLSIQTISGCEDTICKVIHREPNDTKKNILLVGQGFTPADNYFDKAVYDSLTNWNYATSYVKDSVYNKNMKAALYENFDGVFFSPTAHQDQLKRFSFDNYPVPAINLNIHTLKYGQWSWILSNGLQMSSTATGSADNSFITIDDKMHYITGLLDSDELKWSSIEENPDIAQNIGYAIAEANIKYSNKLATIKGVDNDEMWSMITIDSTNELDGLPNKMFVWGLTTAGLQGVNNDGNYTTNACWNILKRATDWTYNTVSFTPPTDVHDYHTMQEENIQVYPNPANQFVYINFPENIRGKGILQITDISGRLVEQMSFELLNNDANLDVDINPYSNGFYYLNIQIGNHTYHEKILIEK